MENKNVEGIEQVIIKVEPGTQHEDTRQTDTSTFDFGGIKEQKIEIHIEHEPFIKEEPISDEERSELIDDTQVCNSTSQSSDSVAMHIKEEPAADVGYDEPAPLPVTQLKDAPTANEFGEPPDPMKIEVEISVDRLEGLSPKNVPEQQIAPTAVKTDVCVSAKRKRKEKKQVKTYQCDLCEKTFNRRGNLKIHVRTHTGERPYKCTSCTKSFVSFSNLYEHKRTHTGFKPYKCDMCDKSFSQQTNFKRHTRVHTGERPYKCTMCDRSFSHSFALQIHIRVHNGDKPHKCHVCDKSFSHQCHLKVHLRIHTGERPYICDICNKDFIQFGDLKKHSRTHTDEKPYKCTICEKGFNDSRNLKRHTLIHTRAKPYKCNTCDNSYTRLYQLKEHARKAHCIETTQI